MVKLNPHFQDLQKNYLFQEIRQRTKNLQAIDPINLGIGDIAFPLPPSIIAALQKAVAEMGQEATFQGYGPISGYSFLKETIADQVYNNRFLPEEIFISNGAKNDCAHLQ